jgi:molybdopterin synthase catalytic subunit
MRITVLFFALARDRAGLARHDLILEDNSSVAVAAGVLAQRFPPLAPMLDRVAFAVNQNYAGRATPLCDGDTLAIIPPVSGGTS